MQQFGLRLQIVACVFFFAASDWAWATDCTKGLLWPFVRGSADRSTTVENQSGALAMAPAAQTPQAVAQPAAALSCTKGWLWPFVRKSGDCLTTLEKEKPGWITTANQPCKVWNPEPQPNESVTWSGACENGLASGKGILKWMENGKPDVEFEGEYENGKRNGPGAIITPDRKRREGVWADDKLLAGGGGANS